MKAKERKSGNGFVICLFIVYVAVLLYLLFFSQAFGRTEHSEYRINYVPFDEIKRFFNNMPASPTSFILNVVGNIVVFIPFGILIPMLEMGRNKGNSKKKPRFILTFLISLCFSVLVELLQFVTRVGVCDVDDVILNTLGGIVGFIIFKLVLKLKK